VGELKAAIFLIQFWFGGQNMKSTIKSRAKNFGRHNFDPLIPVWSFPTTQAIGTAMGAWF
jgi:hypothetical protein